MLLNTRKETRVKFNPGLSANRPSNDWSLPVKTVFNPTCFPLTIAKNINSTDLNKELGFFNLPSFKRKEQCIRQTVC